MKEGSSYIHKLSQCISLPVIHIHYCFSLLRSFFTLSTKVLIHRKLESLACNNPWYAIQFGYEFASIDGIMK